METGLFLIWGAICFGILFLSFSISYATDEIIAALKNPREIVIRFDDEDECDE